MGTIRNEHLFGSEKKRHVENFRCKRYNHINMDQNEIVPVSAMGSSGSERGPVAGCCEDGYELLSSTNGEKRTDHLTDFQLSNYCSMELSL
jgi:hypothetical protein